MILIGSVQRNNLQKLLHEHILDMHTERQKAVVGASPDGDNQLTADSYRERCVYNVCLLVFVCACVHAYVRECHNEKEGPGE